MRKVLWANCPDDQHAREIDEIARDFPGTVFLAQGSDGRLCGFLEASIRPWADGCDSRPVGYIEGWYVDEHARRQGVGRALVGAAESWARSNGCREMASDAELWNAVSHHAHGALGYEETTRLVLFKKDLMNGG
jgi:aminoglycoside 6'-N-acetyltransferase I